MSKERNRSQRKNNRTRRCDRCVRNRRGTSQQIYKRDDTPRSDGMYLQTKTQRRSRSEKQIQINQEVATNCLHPRQKRNFTRHMPSRMLRRKSRTSKIQIKILLQIPSNEYRMRFLPERTNRQMRQMR